jgi:hypothetical protein
MKQRKALLIIPLLFLLAACPASTTQKLATASDAIAHGVARSVAAIA